MFTCISTNANFSQALSIPQHLITKLEGVFRGNKDVRTRSPLRHLLKSNATPSDSEIIAIRALISDAEASIEELHRHFPALDQASLVIESQLHRSIEAHRALLSPVRYLPSEILQEIFFHYADNLPPNNGIATMPWRLGHISHRWRKFALSLPSLWDNIPIIYLTGAGSYIRAFVCLLRRSGSSPTLKLDITDHPFGTLRKVHKGLIKEIVFHSERIERLRILINDIITIHLLQGFKGRLPNLRILRLHYNARAPNLDLFETAPALRRVAIEGSYKDSSVKVLVPWSQITHFEEELKDESVGKFVPLSSLRSLTNLDIYGRPCFFPPSVPSSYPPTTLPNLRTLRILISYYDCRDLRLGVDLFLESLTIPAVEVVKILYTKEPVIPRLVSMFSRSHGPSRLQKLTLHTTLLQTGELSVLLKLTPHLVELDIDLPPAGDLLRLIYGEGEVMLVPMLQALYMRIPWRSVLEGAQIEHLDTLAQVRCELDGSKDSDNATTPSLGHGIRTWTTLHTLRLVFDSAQIRDQWQKTLNIWPSSFTLEEAEAIDMINRCCNCDDIHGKSFVKKTAAILSHIECYEITNKVLDESNLHFKLRRYCIGILTKLPDEDKLKQRFMDLLAEWDQVLNDFSCWTRTSLELHDFTLVYVSKSKLREMRSPDGGLGIVYGLNLSYDDLLQSLRLKRYWR